MLFGHISKEEFLSEYWQKRPLLVRQAFPNFDPIITADELAGIACETDTARIVLEKGGSSPWELRYGPFDEDEFADLPKSHWTLLVNDTEQLNPDLKAIIQPFDFIGDWRIDDLMISYATTGGSVGPHFDEYDVFLIQGSGKRNWQINSQAIDANNFIPDIDLRIMNKFSPEQSWILEPGDMLYLPPFIAHYGVALDNTCMTYSVGFRAPSKADLLESWVDDQLLSECAQQRFQDPDRKPQKNTSNIPLDDLNNLAELMFNQDMDKKSLFIWLGQFLSKSKNQEREIIKNNSKLNIHNNKNYQFIKNPSVKFLNIELTKSSHLFVDGHHFPLFPEQATLLDAICNQGNIINFTYKPNSPTIEKDWHIISELFSLDFIKEI